MKQILQDIQYRGRKLTQHSFFTQWLQHESISPWEKLAFIPMALDTIMGFRELNKYYLKYPKPQNQLEEAITTHTNEDETHSFLLLKDWASLELDQTLAWKPSDLYWWLTSDHTVESRRANFQLISLVYHNPDPLLRFAIIECIETAGNIFFKHTVPIAKILEEKSGREFPYFGEYHLHRETSHLQNTDEQIFIEMTLTPELSEKAESLVSRLFEIYDFHFTQWEKLGRSIQEKRWNFQPATESMSKAVLYREGIKNITAYTDLDYPRLDALKIDKNSKELVVERSAAFQELWQTPFYTWIRQAPNGTFREVLRQVWLQWVVDNWAGADYFLFDTPYPTPTTPLERGINRLSTLFASEMNRRYAEWNLLQLDEYTGWSASIALQHYWLDELVEQNREIFADLRKLTFRYPKALHRYWIMKCFVRFGDALMHSLGIALRNSFENEEDFITLAGLAERLHPTLEEDFEADRAVAELESQPVTSEDFEVIREIIALTKEQESRRAALGWRVIQEQRYPLFADQCNPPSLALEILNPPDC